MRRFRPAFERCERRVVPTMVFILNGNGFAAANPGFQTQTAAELLAARGLRDSTFYAAIERPLRVLRTCRSDQDHQQGRPIGLIGFSAGGAERSGFPHCPISMSRMCSISTARPTCANG